MSIRRFVALAVLGADAFVLSNLTLETSVYGTLYWVGAFIAILAAAALIFNLPFGRPRSDFVDSGLDLSRPVDSIGLIVVLGVVTLIPTLLLLHGAWQGAVLQLKGLVFVFFSREPVRFLLVCGFYMAWIGLGVALIRRIARYTFGRRSGTERGVTRDVGAQRRALSRHSG